MEKRKASRFSTPLAMLARLKAWSVANIPDWAKRVLGGQKDETLRLWASREEARREVENTRWYQMVSERLEAEIGWARQELETTTPFQFSKLQAYVAALKVVLDFVTQTRRNGAASAQLISERVESNRRQSVDEYMETILGRK